MEMARKSGMNQEEGEEMGFLVRAAMDGGSGCTLPKGIRLGQGVGKVVVSEAEFQPMFCLLS